MKRFLLIGGILAGIGISIAIIHAANPLLGTSSTTLDKLILTKERPDEGIKCSTGTPTGYFECAYSSLPGFSMTCPVSRPKQYLIYALSKEGKPEGTPSVVKCEKEENLPEARTECSRPNNEIYYVPVAAPCGKGDTPVVSCPKGFSAVGEKCAGQNDKGTTQINTQKTIDTKKITPSTTLLDKSKSTTTDTQKPATTPTTKITDKKLQDFLKTIMDTKKSGEGSIKTQNQLEKLKENIIIAPKVQENTIILENIKPQGKKESGIALPSPSIKQGGEIFLTVTESFKDINQSSSVYQAITDIVNFMKQNGNYLLPASKKFRPRNKLRPSFAAQIALSLKGESCGIGKAATRAKACLARAYELGLFEKNALADKPMTRGDFYELLLTVLKIPAVESTEGLLCQDVDSSHAYADIVATAKQYGIARRYRVKGEGGYCLPDAPLTKADAAVIASKALLAKQKLGE